MQLFLAEGTPQSFLLELLVNYLQLDAEGKVKVIQLSQAAQKAVQRKDISIDVPCLITSKGEAVKGCWRVAEHLINMSPWQAVLLGETPSLHEQIKSLCDKFPLSSGRATILTELQQYFQPRTFAADNHVTLADLHLFVAAHPQVMALSDKQKWEHNNVYRWFRHIQSLDGIHSFLQLTKRKLLVPIVSTVSAPFVLTAS